MTATTVDRRRPWVMALNMILAVLAIMIAVIALATAPEEVTAVPSRSLNDVTSRVEVASEPQGGQRAPSIPRTEIRPANPGSVNGIPYITYQSLVAAEQAGD
jgi:hypothetical protein